MTLRPRTRRAVVRTVLVPATLAAAVGLGACSALGDPSAAALIDGETVVTQAEVATVLAELPLEVTQGAPLPPDQVLTFLLVSDTVVELSRQYGTVFGEVEARAFLASADEQAGRPAGEYSAPTLELISTNLMLGQLGQDEEAVAAVEEQFRLLADDVEVNPRYGEVAEGGSGAFLVPATHPWLVVPET